APAEAKPADGQKKEFSIPAQSLAKSLEAFSAQTGIDVAARSELLEGKSAPVLSGSMSDAEALSKLLDGSRLGFTFSSPTAVAVTDKPAPSLESPQAETLRET
ncbi:MAG TPA: STN domain-containing protein, partial [Bacteroidia bacterium]|nr:STN domain-containing protein [Bacteroidia bacterium]